MHLGHSNSTAGFGDADHVDEYSNAHFNQQFQSLKWQQLLTNGDELQVHFYRNQMVGDNSVPLGRLSELAVAGGLASNIDDALLILNQENIDDGLLVGGFRHITSERHDLELSHKLHIGSNIRAAWGAGIRYEKLNAEALLEPIEEVSQYQYRLFGNLEWQPAQQWVINAGTIVEKNDTVGFIASPRLGIYLLNSNHTPRFSAVHGNRSPSLLEANEFNVEVVSEQVLLAIRRASDNLDKEKLNSVDIEFIANYPRRGITFDVRLYREQIRDDLDQRRIFFATSPLSDDDDIAIIENTLRSDRKGIELQLQYRPDTSTLLSLQCAYTDLSGTDNLFDAPLERNKTRPILRGY